MKRNFRIDNLSGVTIGPLFIDLHNLYVVTEIATDALGETLTVRFARDHRWEGPADQPGQVSLRCTGDLRVAFTSLASQRPLDEDLEFEIAYFDENCGWHELLDEELAERQGFSGLHLGFSEDLILRVRCAEAEISAA